MKNKFLKAVVTIVVFFIVGLTSGLVIKDHWNDGIVKPEATVKDTAAIDPSINTGEPLMIYRASADTLFIEVQNRQINYLVYHDMSSAQDGVIYYFKIH